MAVGAWLSTLYLGVGLLITVPLAYSRASTRVAATEAAFGVEVRRLIVSQCWARESQIEQLAPGTSLTTTTRFTLGVTEEQTRDISLNLGRRAVDFALPELAAQVSQTRRTEKVQQIEKSILLSNDRTGFHRRFALWRLVNVASIDALVLRDRLRWDQRSRLEFNSSPSIAISSFDVTTVDS